MLCPAVKNMTSSLLSWHKRYDFNAANFQCHTSWKCAIQMLWIRILVSCKKSCFQVIKSFLLPHVKDLGDRIKSTLEGVVLNPADRIAAENIKKLLSVSTCLYKDTCSNKMTKKNHSLYRWQILWMALFSWVPIFVDLTKITHSWGSKSVAIVYYTPRNEVRGYTGITLSVRLSVCLSVCRRMVR